MLTILRQATKDQPVSLKSVARETDVSRRYLEQLAMSLREANLIRSVSGRNGGYFLARPAEEIKILHIVEAAIGPTNIVDCVQQPEICEKADSCESRLIFVLVNARIREVMEAHSLADLNNPEWFHHVQEDLGVLNLGSEGTCRLGSRSLAGCMNQAKHENLLS